MSARSVASPRDRYDVVVVGSGVLGLASAYHLIAGDPGLSVLVVDARPGPGEGSTGASNAMVRDVFSSWDNRVLAQSSIRFYRRLMEERDELRSPVPLLDLYGYLWLLPEDRRPAFETLVAQSGGSIDAQWLDLDALRSCPGLDLAPTRWYEGDRAEAPARISGGFFGRKCGALAPERLVRFYFDEARHRGVEFRFDTCATRLSFEGREEILLHESSKRPFSFQNEMKGRLRISRVVFADGGSVTAERVVVAAGAWAEKLLHPLGIATACSARPELLFAASGPAVEALLSWEPPLAPVDPEGGRARMPFLILPTGAHVKPVFRERRLWLGTVDKVARPIGTPEDPVRDGRLDFDPAKLGDRHSFGTDVLPAIAPYFPVFDTTALRLENAWGGFYHFSPDGLPVLVDEHGVIFVGGDSGSGIMKADALGRLVAARHRGQRVAELYGGESYSVDRLSLSDRAVEPERLIL